MLLQLFKCGILIYAHDRYAQGQFISCFLNSQFLCGGLFFTKMHSEVLKIWLGDLLQNFSTFFLLNHVIIFGELKYIFNRVQDNGFMILETESRKNFIIFPGLKKCGFAAECGLISFPPLYFLYAKIAWFDCNRKSHSPEKNHYRKLRRN